MLLMEQLPPRAWDPSSKRDVCFQDMTGPAHRRCWEAQGDAEEAPGTVGVGAPFLDP